MPVATIKTDVEICLGINDSVSHEKIKTLYTYFECKKELQYFKIIVNNFCIVI